MLTVSRRSNESIIIGDAGEVVLKTLNVREGEARFQLTTKEGRKVFSVDQHESFVIMPGIRFALLHTRSGSARIGIEAPREVPVHREEVYARIQKQRQQMEAA